ncbi:uncharacterized protein LOC115624492 isoform X2 [Scaptodrosophila lebanonensis]|uniref:Uncharacterized protein LOC115624492 isoform X2 n=1 Tax=Drosophila lebanonensis TaxID=7225 RepID=A0A6J2TE52_DROLE|nr:uncharacterized protein LOC115624492 isoform X2 [Scaptodrosophila lebanonensis]
MFRDKKTVHAGSRRQSTRTSAQTSTSSAMLGEMEESELYRRTSEPSLSRTELLLLDYKQFLAARRIQALFRGFYARKQRRSREKAAITIQRWWRGFYVRKNWFGYVENLLQQRCVEHFNRSATKIQALFRGWRTRQLQHDMHSLRRIQVCAAEDLLNCVAFKLHHLLRTYSIPGVYSLRNTHCLSRVERLLASMNFRFHNERVRSAMNRRIARTEENRKEFSNARFHTKVPYGGPNMKHPCPPHCDELLRMSKDMDRRMYKIIEMYEKSQQEMEATAEGKKSHLRLSERRRLWRLKEVLARQESSKRDFCGDVIASMMKWKILDKSKNINNDIFRNPANLEKFLDEISHVLDEVNEASCHCKFDPRDPILCH